MGESDFQCTQCGEEFDITDCDILRGASIEYTPPYFQLTVDVTCQECGCEMAVTVSGEQISVEVLTIVDGVLG